MRTQAALIALTTVVATPALAHGHHHRHHHWISARHHHGTTVAAVGRPSDCGGIPWCGCFMRHLEGVADRSFDLAREWAHFGKPTTPHVGAIVVWSHHVGKIVGQQDGKWVILSGNDGNRVRERVRSVAGAIAFRE